MELSKLTIADARDKLRAKEITAVELTESCIGAVDGGDALNAYCAKTPEIAREQAANADAMLASRWASRICSVPRV